MFKNYFFIILITVSTISAMERTRTRERISDRTHSIDSLPYYIDSSRLTEEEVAQAFVQSPDEVRAIFNYYVENQRSEGADQLSCEFPNIVMFDGPTGTGKSILARAFAQKAEVPFTVIGCAALFYSGIPITELLHHILERHNPHILVMDEIQSAFEREENNSISPAATKDILPLLDKWSKRKELMVIFTGPDYEILPDQFKSCIYRLGFKLPTLDKRTSFIQFLLDTEYQNCHALSEDAVNKIAKNTAHFSIRDIERMFTDSACNCRLRVRSSTLPREINLEDVQKAITSKKKDLGFLPWYNSLDITLHPAIVPALQIGGPVIGSLLLCYILYKKSSDSEPKVHID
jgi:AAA+ superfamily predicted ATPase